MKAQHFQKKLPCQKPMLRQIESGVQNGPILKKGVFRKKKLRKRVLRKCFEEKINLSIRSSYK